MRGSSGGSAPSGESVPASVFEAIDEITSDSVTLQLALTGDGRAEGVEHVVAWSRGGCCTDPGPRGT